MDHDKRHNEGMERMLVEERTALSYAKTAEPGWVAWDGSGYAQFILHKPADEGVVIGFGLLHDEYFWVTRKYASLERAQRIIKQFGLRESFPFIESLNPEFTAVLEWVGLI